MEIPETFKPKKKLSHMILLVNLWKSSHAETTNQETTNYKRTTNQEDEGTKEVTCTKDKRKPEKKITEYFKKLMKFR